MFSKSRPKRRPTQRKQSHVQSTGVLGAFVQLLVVAIEAIVSLLVALCSAFLQAGVRAIAPRPAFQGIGVLHSDKNGVEKRWLVPPQDESGFNRGMYSPTPVPLPRAPVSENEGCVYLLTNPSMPGLVKIGMTKGSPYKRATDLSRGTSVPAPYEVVGYAQVSDRHLVEKEMHTRFAVRRTNAKREFFAVPVAEAKVALQQLAHAYPPTARGSTPTTPTYSAPISRSTEKYYPLEHAPASPESDNNKAANLLLLLIVGGVLCGIVSSFVG